MKIVIDGMGGDNAPQAVVEGACMAVNEYGVDIVITGDEKAINEELKKHSYDKNKISVVHTTEVITNEEKPVHAIRKKKDSSMVVALNMVKNKEADIVISAGSTGALLSGGVFIIKRIKGISRPCICATLPTINGGSTMLADTGANVDCDVQNLMDFAFMTDIYARKVLKKDSPRVALANIGTEEGKGNDLVKKTFEELKNVEGLNFIGNMETREILNGVCDVVVCDGFIGNIVLKTVEGSVLSLFKKLKEAMMSTTKSKIGALLMKSELKEIKDLLDYTSYGGAPFLGVDGGVIKAHGSSNAKSIKNAIYQGIKFHEGEVMDEIKKYVEGKAK
ncbi:phosphate:acyl-[acyl carrier protein] acyltransferase [Peptostreptococcus russellii]|uniref:Phosphate acyltransferase n=1 Tax=Peptostreptococcus russellii TaxID=215200 RepID=A0A1H8FG16_9FIRM|nr:phosphate acyltransferase PlsX [Peptostreptococcus russellii]SEN30575.1 phosphate:acyl-[acyl carrier protein] acyltransferase [Peptostreptococcus russellii]